MSLFAKIRGALAGLALALVASTAQAEEVFVHDGYALSGYDVVSYFQPTGPIEGDDTYTVEHGGAVYRFASAENRDLFAADPDAYTPAYGGYCAYGTANGYKVPTDPFAYRIVDGVLYLNLNTRVQSLWEQDVPGYIRGADNNWPLIMAFSADELRSGVEIEGISLGPQQ